MPALDQPRPAAVEAGLRRRKALTASVQSLSAPPARAPSRGSDAQTAFHRAGQSANAQQARMPVRPLKAHRVAGPACGRDQLSRTAVPLALTMSMPFWAPSTS